MAQKYLPTLRSKQIASFLEKVQAARGRLIFALDATESRQPTWDHACQLQDEMFREAAKIGGLEIQLVYYRGPEFRHSGWTANAHELANQMSRIACLTGETQIARVLAHIREEHRRKPIGAAIFVGDAVEEAPNALYDAVAGLGVPLFLFQEGSDATVEAVFRRLAGLTKGAYAKFDSGATRELSELLRAVAAFAAGGMRALTDLRTESARRLLTQLKEETACR
jgi:hypothetical protein